MDSNMDWCLRPYKEGDEDGIFELKKAVYPDKGFNRELWIKQWRWMFKENPVGEGAIYLAESRGNIVGYYAMRPVMLKAGDRIILAGQTGGAMTHPAYRRQGIFEALGKKIYEEAERRDIHIIYGFPNALSYKGLIKKLNRFTVSNLRGLVRITDWENYLRIYSNNNLMLYVSLVIARLVQMIFFKQKKEYLDYITINKASYFDDQIDELWSRISKQYKFIAVRKKDNLNWRFINIPGIEYKVYISKKDTRINGYIIYRYSPKKNLIECKIMDVLAESEDVIFWLVSRILENCIQDGIGFISCQMIAKRSYFEALKRNGFINYPHRKQSWFELYSDWSQISKSCLLNPKNWYIQPGDSDTY